MPVIYEDQLTEGEPPTNYGPHHFFCGLAAEVVAASDDAFWLLREALVPAFQVIPRKGVNKVAALIDSSHGDLRASGRSVIVVIDADRAAQNLGVQTDQDVAERMLRGVPEADRGAFDVVLLRDNIESVLEWIGSLQGELGQRARAAASSKNRTLRDKVLMRVSRDRGVLRSLLETTSSVECRDSARRVGEALLRRYREATPPPP